MYFVNGQNMGNMGALLSAAFQRALRETVIKPAITTYIAGRLSPAQSSGQQVVASAQQAATAAGVQQQQPQIIYMQSPTTQASQPLITAGQTATAAAGAAYPTAAAPAFSADTLKPYLPYILAGGGALLLITLMKSK